MFTRRFASALIVSSTLVGVGLIGGCKTPTERAESKAVSSIKDFREELTTMNPQIDKVMNSLEQTLAGNNPNPSASFKEFNNEFSKLQKHSRSVAKEADKANQKVDDYFREFNREISKERDASQRSTAIDSEATQRRNYNAYAEMLNNGKRDYRQLVDNLTAIQSKLSAGLNAQSIQEVNTTFSRATDNALSTKGSVSSIIAAIDKAVAAR